jgi:3-dehydrosphinganine reductase
MSESFAEEQKCKPQLTKDIEGTAADITELKKKLPPAKKVADYIVSNINSGDFALCDSSDSAMLWANMIGPSPKRGLGIVDSFLAFLISFLVWPFLRRDWDSKCKKDHYKGSN